MFLCITCLWGLYGSVTRDTFANSPLISVWEILHLAIFLIFSSFICHAQLDLFDCSPLINRRCYFKTLRISLSGRLLFQVFSVFREIFALKLPHWVKNDREAKWYFGKDLRARLNAQLHKHTSTLFYVNCFLWALLAPSPQLSYIQPVCNAHRTFDAEKTPVKKQEALLCPSEITRRMTQSTLVTRSQAGQGFPQHLLLGHNIEISVTSLKPSDLILYHFWVSNPTKLFCFI